jgi:hypothetical protein
MTSMNRAHLSRPVEYPSALPSAYLGWASGLECRLEDRRRAVSREPFFRFMSKNILSTDLSANLLTILANSDMNRLYVSSRILKLIRPFCLKNKAMSFQVCRYIPSFNKRDPFPISPNIRKTSSTVLWRLEQKSSRSSSISRKFRLYSAEPSAVSMSRRVDPMAYSSDIEAVMSGAWSGTAVLNLLKASAMSSAFSASTIKVMAVVATSMQYFQRWTKVGKRSESVAVHPPQPLRSTWHSGAIYGSWQSPGPSPSIRVHEGAAVWGGVDVSVRE